MPLANKLAYCVRVMTTQSLRHQIEGYLERTGKTARAWAFELGITPAYLSQITSGDRIPALALAIRMHRETGIPYEAFVPGGSAGPVVGKAEHVA